MASDCSPGIYPVGVTPLVVAMGLNLGFRESIPASVVLIPATMPVGLVPSILAQRYNTDSKLAAGGMLWSTLALG